MACIIMRFSEGQHGFYAAVDLHATRLRLCVSAHALTAGGTGGNARCPPLEVTDVNQPEVAVMGRVVGVVQFDLQIPRELAQPRAEARGSTVRSPSSWRTSITCPTVPPSA